jgi:crotonobetainyl-CoA:carnitine CoA-transferase CaiB-like acyl-CoA transferase
MTEAAGPGAGPRPGARAGEAAGWPSGPGRVGPLAGLRVLDLSRILAGPFATMQLADLGADVIKVEAPGNGDETRRWGPPFTEDGTAAYFLAINRNKRAITLDLGHPAAAALARRLALAADVVVDNFLPGRLARFGLDHGRLRAANPGLVSCTISGYGSDGPAAERPGFDFLIQAEGGIMSITGQPGSEPTKVGVAIADLAAGLFATIGVLAALRERDATGAGRHVEVALLDAQVAMLANQAMNWLVGGITPGRMGNAHPSIAPYESYRTGDGPIAIGVGTDRQFAKLAEAIGAPELAGDERFRGNAERVARREELKREIERRLAGGDRDEWLERLAAAGVPAAPINAIPEVFGDPLVRARALVEVGGVPQVRSPVRVDGRPVAVDTAPPALGRDTNSVLAGLGLGADELAALRQARAI